MLHSNTTTTLASTSSSGWPEWLKLSQPGTSSITKTLDVLLLLALVFSSVTVTLPELLSLFIRDQKRPHPAPPRAKGFVVPAFTRHARFLPRPSAHKFHYNTLYLAVRLDALESHQLDSSHAFAWRGKHFEPEWQDEHQLARQRLVQSGTASLNHTPSAASASPPLQDWKASMRRSERRERRSKEEQRRKNTSATMWSLMALHPDSYLRNSFDQKAAGKAITQGQGDKRLEKAQAEWIKGSVLLKLAYELRERGYLKSGPQDEAGISRRESWWAQELGQVWTVTMPSFMGITGINPLTVHYCYRPSKSLVPAGSGHQSDGMADDLGDFWLVVLEVHNTFAERHLYVLEAGVGEDEIPESGPGSSRRRGYDHQWTFARSFHVSPFNDRGGFYRLFLTEPLSRDRPSDPFKLGIRLLLLVESQDDKKPKTLEKKLMASLDSYPTHHARRVLPLSALSLYTAVLRQPFDLLLTFARILFEAGKLHFLKRLDAFARPDMVQTDERMGVDFTPFDGVGLPPPTNGIQPHRSASVKDASASAAGVLYPDQGWNETLAKHQLALFAAKRIDELKREDGCTWSLQVSNTDPADHGISIGPESADRTVVLYTRSGSVYTDLHVMSSPGLALLLGSLVGRRWGVNDVDAFKRFFQVTAHGQVPSTLALRLARGARRCHWRWLTSRASSALNLSRDQVEHRLAQVGTAPPMHPLDAPGVNTKLATALWLAYLAGLAEETAFAWLGARYVPGTEPWLELARGVKWLEEDQDGVGYGYAGPSWDAKLGSVRQE